MLRLNSLSDTLRSLVLFAVLSILASCDKKDEPWTDDTGVLNDPERVCVTSGVTDLSYTSVTLYGYVNNTESLKGKIYYGFVYSTEEKPTVNNGNEVIIKSLDDNDSVSATLSSLSPDVTYYYRVFLCYNDIYLYGKVRDFTTADLPFHSGAVDMGLSVKWAACNLGASSAEEYGNYYAWGEITEKQDFSWSTYKWCEGSSTALTKYNSIGGHGVVDGNAILNDEDDVANMVLGGHWHIPTADQWAELRNNCVLEFIPYKGVNGFIVTSRLNGNKIFFPAAGCRKGVKLEDEGSQMYHWASTVGSYGADFVWNVGVASADVFHDDLRYCGYSIRPVTK